MIENIQLRVSFFDSALDIQSSPIIFSQEVLVPANLNSKVQAQWRDNKLPCLYSANNTPQLAKESRLIMFIWACGPAENFPNEEMLIG